MPKTGGQALSTWLVERLGTGCVSPDLMGGHRELIETYAGHHSIISGHLQFFDGETLDPRYQYVTCLREPVERVLSWLYYILNDSGLNARSKPIKEVARAFLESEGKELPSDLVHGYSNYYMYHFSSIASQGRPRKTEKAISREDKFTAALSALRQYDVVGIYEEFQGFTAEVANLIGIDAPKNVRKVNVSTPRPPAGTISKTLRDRILELNQDDIRLYSEVMKWKKQRELAVPAKESLFGWIGGRRKTGKAPPLSAAFEPNRRGDWVKYEPRETLLTADFGSLSVADPIPRLIAGQRKTVHVTATNKGFQTWRSSVHFPLKAGYHWLRPNGEIYNCEYLMTPLPDAPLPPGASITVDVAVTAPREPGVYTLVLTIFQEYYCRLEQRGLTPAIIQVTVEKPAAPAPAKPVEQ